MPPMAAMQQPGLNPYYTSQPTASAPYSGAGSYVSNLSPPSTAPGGVPPGNPALSNLPPNILALLQSTQQQQQRPPLPPGQSFGAPMNVPPPAATSTQQPPGGVNPQYQQLMAYLVSLARYRNSVATLILYFLANTSCSGRWEIVAKIHFHGRRLTFLKKKKSLEDFFLSTVSFLLIILIHFEVIFDVLTSYLYVLLLIFVVD
jgi:hypothetical protein